jgi:hypothetical protein
MFRQTASFLAFYFTMIPLTQYLLFSPSVHCHWEITRSSKKLLVRFPDNWIITYFSLAHNQATDWLTDWLTDLSLIHHKANDWLHSDPPQSQWLTSLSSTIKPMTDFTLIHNKSNDWLHSNPPQSQCLTSLRSTTKPVTNYPQIHHQGTGFPICKMSYRLFMRPSHLLILT